MNHDEAFLQAVGSFSDDLRRALAQLPRTVRASCTEVRLRRDRPVAVLCRARVQFLRPGGRLCEVPQPDCIVTSAAVLEQTFQRMCAYSVHSHQPQIRAGYLTLPGGHRVGLCGRAVLDGSQLGTVRDLTSMVLRIHRWLMGAADEMLRLASPQQYTGVVIAGPPGSGKTTILRDLAQQLSSPGGLQVAVVDEKGELSGGENLGVCCDVLYGYPKAEGIQQAVRNLAPQLILCDEVGTTAEFSALAEGLYTGVRMAVSVHCNTAQECYLRPVIRTMLASGGFQRVVLLSGIGQIAAVYQVEAQKNEVFGTDFTLCRVYGMGMDAVHPAG